MNAVMRMIATLGFLAYIAGVAGWNNAGSRHDDWVTPMALIWPLIAAYHFADNLYEETQ